MGLLITVASYQSSLVVLLKCAKEVFLMTVKNCQEMQTKSCTMLALDQRVIDFSMIEYTFEAIVTQ